MLIGRKLFEYENSKKNLDKLTSELDNLEAEKEELEKKFLNQKEKIIGIKKKTITDETRIELALAEQNLILLNKDMERFQHRWMEKSFSLMQTKMDHEHKTAEIKLNLSADVWKEYNRINEVVDNPIAEVRHQMCTGCFMTLSQSNISKWRKGKQLTYCEVCGRILA